MYAYPAQYMQPPEPPRTPIGVKWTVVALAIYLPFMAVSIVVSIYTYSVLSNLPSGGFVELFSALAALALVSAITVIFGVLVLIFYFIGFGYLYGGRNEMGPAHARNLKIALPLLIVAFSLDLAGRVASFFITSSAITFDFFSGRITFNPNALYLGVVVSTTVGILVAAMCAAVLVLSVRALAKPGHQTLLYAAAGIGTATPGIAGALALLQLPRLVATIQDFVDSGGGGGFFGFVPSIDPALGVPALVMSGLGLVTGLLYFVVYRAAGERLKTGELKPVLPPAAPVTPWMPTAPYAYGPPPPAPMAPPAQPAEPPAQPPA
ncbi:MAG TPA: hypothetical protein VGR51_07715 [Thermoplasmata archaeon]|nr:hypothetical protein [Thermoplasmata archaeon]